MWLSNLFLSFLTFAQSDDLTFLKQQCIETTKANKNASAVCDCYHDNLKKRLDADYVHILVKDKKHQSIVKELREVEGATVIFRFEKEVMTECLKNPKWDVGPEDRGTDDE
ncbi:MAG: hypothetical protein H6623_03185 [Bdellovibrionaceae bacterium]|nr:hypothetical protein [Pseudobdellovibrionaceae bacterium]